jgi:uncharacterized membrane protein
VEPLLHIIATYVALTLEAIAILLITIGSIEALAGVLRFGLFGHATGMARRAVWLDFARWIVAALTFQLAADIVSTSFSPTWDEVGRLAAIAGIRTFLSFFLDRELESTRELQRTRDSEALNRQA